MTVLWQKLHREKSVVRHLEWHHDVSRKKVTVVFQILPLKCGQRKHIFCASHEKGCLTENANIEISSLTRIRIKKPISCLFIASQICPSICSIWWSDRTKRRKLRKSRAFKRPLNSFREGKLNEFAMGITRTVTPGNINSFIKRLEKPIQGLLDATQTDPWLLSFPWILWCDYVSK